MNDYIKWERDDGLIFFQVLNDIPEDVQAVERSLLDKGYLIDEVGSMNIYGFKYPIIRASKIKSSECKEEKE